MSLPPFDDEALGALKSDEGRRMSLASSPYPGDDLLWYIKGASAKMGPLALKPIVVGYSIDDWRG